MMGPGNNSEDLDSAIPLGTRFFQAEIAPSGHVTLPCAVYESSTIFKDEQGLKTKKKLHSELKLPASELQEFTQETLSRQPPTTQAE